MAIDTPPAMTAPAPSIPAAPAGFSAERAARRTAQEVAGAVVVVEDGLPPLPPPPPTLRIRGFTFSAIHHRPGTGPVPMPDWMDPNVTRAGGNVVHRNYTIGGVGF